MSRTTVAALFLLAAVCGASAARSSSWDRIGSMDEGIKWLLDDKKGGKGDREGAYITTKFKVPPSMASKFEDMWGKHEGDTLDEKGVIMYGLSKTMGDNIYYWTYGEWETMRDYIDHLESDHTKQFMDFLDETDITFERFPLQAMTKPSKERKNVSKRGGGGDKGDDPRDMAAHMVMQYHVPPSMLDDFIDMWKDTAEKTWDEKDNFVYSLRKVGTMNHHFLAYGSWDSFDAYLDHFQSKHVRKMRDFFADNDITWYLEPVINISFQKE